ncbi:hypothetical protein [Candidatus Symbiopectobacterium sp. NZEC135]|uniref:hypothetical protein n=1 Tax=Candidatus Symbiopectobacterium sp. NZEC135 TaxID=2820471 RepID=UPI002225D6DF|nr:hypothetical protein [Candidatus Symbiopectobacterium sp. NZEC135]MCW2477756.1 hypothetical protein [Candidatus Symbiopectobacterium sp. NZEC135]
MNVTPKSGMKVKWRSVYWPLGEWVNDSGDVVDITTNFKGHIAGKSILVIMNNSMSSPGHGEPSITAATPSYIDGESLDSLPEPLDYIEIE